MSSQRLSLKTKDPSQNTKVKIIIALVALSYLYIVTNCLYSITSDKLSKNKLLDNISEKGTQLISTATLGISE